MVTRIGSSRRKTRKKLTKSATTRGKLSLTKYFAKFNTGEIVVLKAEPAVQGGCYHMRFHGKRAVVGEHQGKCYCVTIKDGGKAKKLIVHPVHLRRIQDDNTNNTK